MTTPQLFASAKNIACPAGEFRCFYCAAPCRDGLSVDRYRSSTFTGWSDVAVPASFYVCAGCAACTSEPDRANRPRQWCWIISRQSARWCGRTDAVLADACLHPPEPPFAIVIAISGQKHLIYRAPVNFSRDTVTVQMELDRVTFSPTQLRERMNLVGRVVAAAGKPAAQVPPAISLAIRIGQYWTDSELVIGAWTRLWSEPLSRLAAFLTPKMEDCRNVYPTDNPTAIV